MSERDRQAQRRPAPEMLGRGPDPIVGKYTLLDQVQLAASPNVRDGGGGDASQDVLVSQYGKGCNHVNDCGPACVLMVVKAMHLEDKLKQLVSSEHPEQVTVQQELNEVRRLGDNNTGDNALYDWQVRAYLEKVLEALGAPHFTELGWKMIMPRLYEQVGHTVYDDGDKGTDRAEQFIRANTAAGSAVILEGTPNRHAWGWGGMQDPGNAYKVRDAGLHFVFVWRPNARKEQYDVLDPSWSAPKRNLPLATVLAFVMQGRPVNAFAVPYAELASTIGKPVAQPGAALPATGALPRLDLQDVRGTGGERAAQSRPAAPPGPLDGKLVQAVLDARAKSPGPIHDIDPASPYGRAVLALWQDCDAHLPDPDRVRDYMRAPLDPEVKRATLGLIAARRARFEFLLGWMLQGGIHMTKTNWENRAGVNAEGTDSSTNSGTLVDRYTGSTSGYGLTTHDWCGMFVGFAMRHAGMSPSSGAYFALASVPRALQWIASHPGDGVVMKPAEIASGAVRPQPGDVVVLEHHVSIVEAFDADTKQLSTIDGNVGLLGDDRYASNAVSGRTYDMASPPKKGAMKILVIYRPGLEAFGGSSAKPAAVVTDNSRGEAFVAQVDGACRQLTALWSELQLAGHVEDHLTVAQNATANAQ